MQLRNDDYMGTYNIHSTNDFSLYNFNNLLEWIWTETNTQNKQPKGFELNIEKGGKTASYDLEQVAGNYLWF